MSFSENLKAERKRQELFQKDLAELSGVSVRTIQRIEKPDTEHPVEVRRSVLDRLDVALWINNAYRIYGNDKGALGYAVKELKQIFEDGTLSTMEAKYATMNFDSFFKAYALPGEELPQNLPGLSYWSLFDTPAGTRERSINTKPEHDLMIYFRQLNANGQDEAIRYTEYLTHSPELKSGEEADNGQ